MKLHARLAALPVQTWTGRRIAWVGGSFIAVIALVIFMIVFPTSVLFLPNWVFGAS